MIQDLNEQSMDNLTHKLDTGKINYTPKQVAVLA
jgi:hypothetical protein